MAVKERNAEMKRLCLTDDEAKEVRHETRKLRDRVQKRLDRQKKEGKEVKEVKEEPREGPGAAAEEMARPGHDAQQRAPYDRGGCGSPPGCMAVQCSAVSTASRTSRSCYQSHCQPLGGAQSLVRALAGHTA